jgi:hypothetical protein
MSEKKDILDEIFSLMHLQMQARQDGSTARQAEEYEQRAKRIDRLLNRLIGPKSPIVTRQRHQSELDE